MSANRHLGRIVALQTLYEQDFRLECEDKSFKLKDVLKRNLERYADTIDDKEFINELVNGISAKQVEIDAILGPVAPEWPIEQIARMDRIVLRIGIFELMFSDGAPPKVVINEAVELAKAFGGDNSSKFINGVLGTVLRNKEEADSPAKPAVQQIQENKPKKPATKSKKKLAK